MTYYGNSGNVKFVCGSYICPPESALVLLVICGNSGIRREKASETGRIYPWLEATWES